MASLPDTSPVRALLLDLDGTVYRGDAEVPGAAQFVADMTAAGIRCMFVTNRANRPVRTVRDQLRGYGIPCEDVDVLTTSEATASYLGSGSAFLIGEAGLQEAFEAQGFTITDQSPDYVVASFDSEFTYAKLKTACTLIYGGARFIATNPDACLVLEGSLSPGTGAIVSAIATGSCTAPTMVGKPEPLLFELACERLGLTADGVVAVGDNLDTDILAGNRAGVRTALMLTGHSKREEIGDSEAEPTWVCESYADLRECLGL